METNNLKTIKPLPPQVASWFISLDEVTGVYELIINTVDRWVEYCAVTDTQFRIAEPEETEEAFGNFEIPSFLPKCLFGHYYIRCDCQNKDQIHFYWIPRVHRRSETILSSRQTENL